MADVFSELYIYPPGHTAQTSGKGTRTFAINCTGVLDGAADLTQRVVVDLSTFKTVTGAAPARCAVELIEYTVNGIEYVKLEWDRTSDQTIAVLKGYNTLDWTHYNGHIDPGSGGTGDILLSAVGVSVNSNYDITIYGRLKDS